MCSLLKRLPRVADKEWSRIRTLDQDVWDSDLVAHPITHGADMTIEEVKFMYESQAYFARKVTADSNFLSVKKELLKMKSKKNAMMVAHERPVLDIESGKFVIPQYLHSQLFDPFSFTNLMKSKNRKNNLFLSLGLN